MEPDSEFFSRDGKAVCFSPDGVSLYFWNGTGAGNLSGDKIYAAGGKFLGWYADGWLYDRRNYPALFSKGATGGPYKPAIRPVSNKGITRGRTKASSNHYSHERPPRQSTWSHFSDESYFTQEEKEGE